MGNLSIVKGLICQYSDKTIRFQSAHKECIFIFPYEGKHKPMNFSKKRKWNYLARCHFGSPFSLPLSQVRENNILWQLSGLQVQIRYRGCLENSELRPRKLKP